MTGCLVAMATEGLITVTSNAAPREALRRLEKAITERGMTIFARIDHAIFQQLWRWACARHPRKGRRWIKDRCFFAARAPLDFVERIHAEVQEERPLQPHPIRLILAW